MKKDMMQFIKLKCPKLHLKEVLDINVKDTDDEYGPMGEHYIVKCDVHVPDFSIPMDNLCNTETRKCLVNISEFKNWLSSRDAVKWIN